MIDRLEEFLPIEPMIFWVFKKNPFQHLSPGEKKIVNIIRYIFHSWTCEIIFLSNEFVLCTRKVIGPIIKQLFLHIVKYMFELQDYHLSDLTSAFEVVELCKVCILKYFFL